MVEKEDRVATMKIKTQAFSGLSHLRKQQKEKKNFLHTFHSLLLHSNILPMKPFAEKSCVRK